MKKKLLSSALVVAAIAPPLLALPYQKQGAPKQNARRPAPQKEGKDAPRKKIEEKVKEAILDQLGVDEAKVTPDARMVEDLGADSLDIVELFMTFEQEFGSEIECEDMEGPLRVRDIYDYVEKSVRQSSAKAR